MKTYGPFLLVFIGITSCTVGPEYEAPLVTPPEKFLSQQILNTLNEGKQDTSFASDWWKGFNSLILNELVEKALDNNFEIAAAYSNVKAAQARLRLAGAGDGLMTNLSLDSSLEESRVLNGPRSDATTISHTADLDVVLPLDLFGKTTREIQAARAVLERACAELEGIILGISSEVASEYLKMRGNQKQLELLKESVALQEKTLSIVKSRYEAGLSPELDLRRAETSVESLRSGIPTLEESLLNSRNRLASLTGQYAGTYETLLSKKEEVPLYQYRIPSVVPFETLSTHPDVRQAEAALKEAIARIGVAEADFYPIFKLSGGAAIGTTAVNGLTPTDFLIGTLNALIQQVLTDGGTRKANLAIAKAEAEKALADYEQALRLTIENVETSLAAIEGSLARQIPLEKAVNSSQRSFLQAETLYQQGLISFLDVVDAQRVLANTKQDLAREQTNYSTQIALLFQSLGVLPPEL